MPVFLVEDETGLEDATSYVSEAYADDYLGSSWAADTAAKEAALMAGTEYADARWGARLKGYPLVTTQGLEFPRQAIYDRYGNPIEGVPDDWKKAVCLYASYYVGGTLYPSIPTTAKDIKRKKTVVGPIITEVEYQGSAVATSFLKFPLADRLVKGFLYGGGGSGGAIRN